MVGIPVSSTLQSAVKQVAISSGQILVAKGSPSVSKVMGGKQVLAQGVAKAIVSGASSISQQQTGSKAAGGPSGKSGGQPSLSSRRCRTATTTLFSFLTDLKSYLSGCYR